MPAKPPSVAGTDGSVSLRVLIPLLALFGAGLYVVAGRLTRRTWSCRSRTRARWRRRSAVRVRLWRASSTWQARRVPEQVRDRKPRAPSGCDPSQTTECVPRDWRLLDVPVGGHAGEAPQEDRAQSAAELAVLRRPSAGAAHGMQGSPEMSGHSLDATSTRFGHGLGTPGRQADRTRPGGRSRAAVLACPPVEIWVARQVPFSVASAS